MSRSYDRSSMRVSLTARELRARQKAREAKAHAASVHVELLERAFDYQQSDIYEMLNMRRDTHYSE